MNRYLLFGGPAYYPSGGWEDLQGNFETANGALGCVARIIQANEGHVFMVLDWWHVVDSETGQIVHSSDDAAKAMWELLCTHCGVSSADDRPDDTNEDPCPYCGLRPKLGERAE